MRFNLKHELKKTYDAFILLEVVIALSIMTVSSVYFVTNVLKVKEFYCSKTTKKNIEVVISILADFVSRYGRLPYPGTPDGYEIDWPMNELDWETNPKKFMTGIVPYRTLGISPETVKDGYGYFLSYRINPTLGGRKSITSVAPHDIRAYLDIIDTKHIYLESKPESLTKYNLTLNPACHGIKLTNGQYSSYTSVRSYLKSYHEVSDEPEKVNTKTWDIAFRIPGAQLKCFMDGQIYVPTQEFHLIPPHTLNLINSTAHQVAFLAGLAAHILSLETSYTDDIAIKFKSIVPGVRSEEYYKVKDCIALVLISHGKSHGGAILPNKKVLSVPPNASREKIGNSNETSDPSTFYVKADNNNSFDDVVRWVSRFELATMGRFSFKPTTVTVVDFLTAFDKLR